MMPPVSAPLARRSSLALLACLLPLMSACAALDEFEEVLVDETTIPATSPVASPFAPGFGGGFGGIELSKSRAFGDAGVSPSDVDAIFVRSVRIEADSGSGNLELDRLDRLLTSINLYVEAPGQERRVIAQLAAFPAAASADLLVETMLNLKPWAVAPSMSIGAELVLTRRPAVNVKLKTTVTLLVDVNLLGS
jgi:hypothetical protein